MQRSSTPSNPLGLFRKNSALRNGRVALVKRSKASTFTVAVGFLAAFTPAHAGVPTARGRYIRDEVSTAALASASPLALSDFPKTHLPATDHDDNALGENAYGIGSTTEPHSPKMTVSSATLAKTDIPSTTADVSAVQVQDDIEEDTVQGTEIEEGFDDFAAKGTAIEEIANSANAEDTDLDDSVAETGSVRIAAGPDPAGPQKEQCVPTSENPCVTMSQALQESPELRKDLEDNCVQWSGAVMVKDEKCKPKDHKKRDMWLGIGLGLGLGVFPLGSLTTLAGITWGPALFQHFAKAPAEAARLFNLPNADIATLSRSLEALGRENPPTLPPNIDPPAQGPADLKPSQPINLPIDSAVELAQGASQLTLETAGSMETIAGAVVTIPESAAVTASTLAGATIAGTGQALSDVIIEGTVLPIEESIIFPAGTHLINTGEVAIPLSLEVATTGITHLAGAGASIASQTGGTVLHIADGLFKTIWHTLTEMDGELSDHWKAPDNMKEATKRIHEQEMQHRAREEEKKKNGEEHDNNNRAQIERARAHVDQLKKRLAKGSAELEKLKAQEKGLENDTKKQESQKKRYQDELIDLRRNARKIEKDLKDIRVKHKQAMKDRDSGKKKYSEAWKEFETRKEESKALSQKLKEIHKEIQKVNDAKKVDYAKVRKANIDMQKNDAEAKKAHNAAKTAEDADKKAHEEVKKAHDDQHRAEQDKKKTESEAKKAHNDAKNAENADKRAHDEVNKAHDAQHRAEADKKKTDDANRRAHEDLKKAEDANKRAHEDTKKAQDATKRAHDETKKAEDAKHRAEQDKKKAEEANKRAHDDLKKEEDAKKRAEGDRKKAEEAKKREENDRRRAGDELKKAQAEVKRVEADKRRLEEAKKHARDDLTTVKMSMDFLKKEIKLLKGDLQHSKKEVAGLEKRARAKVEAKCLDWFRMTDCKRLPLCAKHPKGGEVCYMPDPKPKGPKFCGPTGDLKQIIRESGLAAPCATCIH